MRLIAGRQGPACKMQGRLGVTGNLRGRCPVCALRQRARGGDPSTPTAGPANANSQGWGPQDPKRPVGPPFPGTWSPTSPLGLVCPWLVSGRLCHVRGLLPWRVAAWTCRALTTPCARCALLVPLSGARLPAGGRTLVCPRAPCLPMPWPGAAQWHGAGCPVG